jgi:hypothetical protein
MRNARFEAYYKAQNIISDEREWNELIDALRRGLPLHFALLAVGCRLIFALLQVIGLTNTA